MSTKAESLGLRNPKNIVFSEYVPALKMVRVPCNLLGMILGRGRASAYAAHLLAIKCSKGSGFVLNEQHVARAYGISRRAFQAGMRVLTRCQVLERNQPNHRAYATEKLAEPSRNFVSVSETLLQAKSAEVAFVIAANLSPKPSRPAEIAERIGITSRMAVSRLTREAVKGDFVSFAIAAHGTFWLARKGMEIDRAQLGGAISSQDESQMAKNVPAKNVPAKNDPAHSRCKKGTDTESKAQKSEKSASYATRSPKSDRVAAADNHEILVLRDWRTAAFWRDDPFEEAFSRPMDSQGYDIDEWKRSLHSHGGAPGQIAAPHGYSQALEIVHYLTAMLGNDDIRTAMHALAFWICQKHAAGKTIRSLAFIAEELAHRCNAGDDAWLYDLPSRLPDEEFQAAADLGPEIVDALESYSIPVNRRNLLSTQGVDRLASAIRCCTPSGVILGMNSFISKGVKPDDGRAIAGWSYFDKYIAAAMEPKSARRRRR